MEKNDLIKKKRLESIPLPRGGQINRLPITDRLLNLTESILTATKSYWLGIG
jgi:hypothetical protein